MSDNKRGLGLFSGGLDSMLAAAVLREQGIEVTGVVFVTPFFGAERARESAAHLHLPLLEQDITEAYYPLLTNPPHGFGSRHNPCIDCHILMLHQAGALMEAWGFDFLFTGEVLGQRPMSQQRGALTLIARQSGYEELIVRPLSAKLLPPTRPELLGWVDRDRLLDLRGRGRKRQMELAARLGIDRYPAPAGGCLLTDPGYAARLKELLSRNHHPSRRDLELLKWGRHFRLPGGGKAVVGRTQVENEALSRLLAPGDLVVRVQGVPGPLVLVPHDTAAEAAQDAALLAAAYSDAPEGLEVRVLLRQGEKILSFPAVAPSKDRFREWLIGG
ncbi:MAG: tRNA 4-thiouridine(8) synthase ThiI [Desulfobaccales bacterium]